MFASLFFVCIFYFKTKMRLINSNFWVLSEYAGLSQNFYIDKCYDYENATDTDSETKPRIDWMETCFCNKDRFCLYIEGMVIFLWLWQVQCFGSNLWPWYSSLGTDNQKICSERCVYSLVDLPTTLFKYSNFKCSSWFSRTKLNI